MHYLLLWCCSWTGIQGNIAFKPSPISNIKIGDNVTISSNCDFRIREKGMIIIESNVTDHTQGL